MGYLAQKKKNIREINFLTIGWVIVAILSGLLFFNSMTFLKNNFFIIYILNIILVLYSLFIRRFGFALLFLTIVVVNFFHITSTSRLFFNKTYNSGEVFEISYDADNLADYTIDSVSKMVTNNIFSSLLKLPTNNKDIAVIKLDFSTLSLKSRQKQLDTLYKFVVAQDIPVIVIGDFGTTVWHPDVQSFLKKSSLKVINKLIFASKGIKNNYFYKPSFYVLSFDGYGVKDIKVTSPSSEQDYPNINLNFIAKD